MAMPRPKGEALKIAKATVPGLMSEDSSSDHRGRKPTVEEAAVELMENPKGIKVRKMKRKEQGYNARLDESLGMRHRGRHKQSLKARRDESKGMEKAMGRRAYSGNKGSGQGRRK